jgi:hypothetical protein
MSTDQDVRVAADESVIGKSGITVEKIMAVESPEAGLSAGEYLEIARIHHREAERLVSRAQTAQGEDRQHEAMLLTDLAIAQRERALEYEKAAKGEGNDPVVAEILDGLREQRSSFSPAEGQLLGDMSGYPREGRFARAMAWITRR